MGKRTQKDMLKLLELNEDTELIIICAMRYAIGRQTYMPTLVQDYIRPLFPKLSDKTLQIIVRDIETAYWLGDETIDKPGWIAFCNDAREVLLKRGTTET